MALATPATEPKRDVRKTCTVCRKKFTPSHRSVMTCSEDCKRARRNRSAKSTTQKSRNAKPFPMSNAFIQLLLRHAKQAGTVQIFQFITASQLLELREMHKTQQAANAWSRDAFGKFQFCHIYPVAGQPFMGKFVPANLVIGSAELNYEHGNRWYGGGEYIRREDKSVRWDIARWMTDIDIVELMIECIGKAVWAEFYRVAKLAPSKRQSHVEALTELLDRADPDHREWLKALGDPRTSTQGLGSILEAVTGKRAFASPMHWVTPMEVAIAETRRLMTYRPGLKPLLDGLEQIEQLSRYVDSDSYILGASEVYVFDTLHGQDIDLHTLELFVYAALSKVADKVGSFDRVKAVRPIDTYTPEQLANYHSLVATGRSVPAGVLSDCSWLDKVLVAQTL